jgi:hypothetical protein
MRQVLETYGTRTWDMRILGTGAREPDGRRLQHNYFLFPSPEGEKKIGLGGELRREEQLSTRTGMCTDRDGTVDDLSKRGGFSLAFPL